MNIYKRKSTLVNAFKWTGFKNSLLTNVNSIELKCFSFNENGNLTVHNVSGSLTCAAGDYVIRKGINNYCCCKADEFFDEYEIEDFDSK